MLLSDLVDLIKKGNSNFISANIFEDLNIDDAASLDSAVKYQISFLETKLFWGEVAADLCK